MPSDTRKVISSTSIGSALSGRATTRTHSQQTRGSATISASAPQSTRPSFSRLLSARSRHALAQKNMTALSVRLAASRPRLRAGFRVRRARRSFFCFRASRVGRLRLTGLSPDFFAGYRHAGYGSDEGVSCCAGASPASAPSSSASATSGGRSGRTGSGSGLGLRPGFSPLSTTPANSRSCSAARPAGNRRAVAQHRPPAARARRPPSGRRSARHQMQPVGAQKKARGNGRACPHGAGTRRTRARCPAIRPAAQRGLRRSAGPSRRQ